MRLIYCFLICCCFFMACQKEDNTPNAPLNIESAKGVFISNEGGFNAGNASVSYYDFATKNIRNKIFQDANARSLGDVLQSMAI
ncbi:MAG: DUF5074 domain-containing protein, partial [Saprospiraceae bacterium]